MYNTICLYLLQYCMNDIFTYICRDEENAKDPINTMPGVYRYGINQLEKLLQPLIAKGLQSVLLFGVSQHLQKVTFIKHDNIIFLKLYKTILQHLIINQYCI